MNYGTAALRAEVEDRALEDIRFYLRAWRRWCHAWKPMLGYPSQAPFVRVMRPSVAWDSDSDQRAEADSRDEEVDAEILRALDVCVASLPVLHRIAVRIIYLRETGPAVWRSNRLSLSDAAKLCGEAERELIIMLRRKNVLL